MRYNVWTNSRMEGKMEYTENYYSLSHGTDEQSAKNIVSNGFVLKGDTTSWCGEGVYFYDIKAKAWWAANRKCQEIKKQNKSQKVKPAIILVDIENIPKKETFDLRVKKDLKEFDIFIKNITVDNYQIKIDEADNEFERKILLRSMLISFYAKEMHCKLVIGNFKQRPQSLNENAIKFADSLDMVFGIETIYCVKDISIISNVRLGGGKK